MATSYEIGYSTATALAGIEQPQAGRAGIWSNTTPVFRLA